MHKTCPKLLKKNNIKKPGEFSKTNQHGGQLWGLPSECNMTNRLARDIMFKCIDSGKLTYHQLRAVRKSLCYTRELKGGRASENWSGVAVAWDTLKQEDLPDQKRNLIPLRIPTPQGLKKAWTTKYDPKGWPLPKFCVGTLAAYDVFIYGLRAGTDTDRIKKSRKHTMNIPEGWMNTEFKVGRAKLGKGKFRPWSAWRICLCDGKKHKSPPDGAKWELNIEHRPTKDLTWEPTCPLAAMEFIGSYTNAENKCYPCWLDKSKRFAKYNVNDVVTFAIEWMKQQNACPEGESYDHNSGRKSLARLLEHLSISYRWGFEIHGDLEDVWRGNYQPKLPKSNFKKRLQSRDPEEATHALRRIAKWFGRGCERKIKYTLDVGARLSYHLLKQMGQQEMADKIVQGLPSDSEDEEFMNKKEEEDESDEESSEAEDLKEEMKKENFK